MNDSDGYRGHCVCQPYSQFLGHLTLQVRDSLWPALNTPTPGRVQDCADLLAGGGIFAANEQGLGLAILTGRGRFGQCREVFPTPIPLSLLMMSRSDFRSAPNDWVVVGD